MAWMSAGMLGCVGEMVDPTPAGPLPVCPPRIAAVWDERLRGVACGRCQGLEHEDLMAVCDRCEVPYHTACVEDTAPVGVGPWYCP